MRLKLFPNHAQPLLRLQHPTNNNPFFKSKRFSATTTQHSQNKEAATTIDHLPDEIITLILLSIQDVDIEMLCTIAAVTPKFRRIAMDLIRRYMLPGIQLNTLIDQEGRRRFTTHYFFQALDEEKMMATFIPLISTPKRVRNDNYAALPTLRRLCMSDSGHQAPVNKSGPPPRHESLNRRQASWHTLDSMTPTMLDMDSNTNALVTKKRPLKVAQAGHHVSCSNRMVPSTSGSSNNSVWQMGYRVDEGSGSDQDRYVTPTHVHIHLSLLWQQKKRNHTSHAWTTSFGWIKKKKTTTTATSNPIDINNNSIIT
ncbi:hypothetical protein O0I10_004398 [Lichtheimia ornata]|uniref:F-box domain-containing protein n=1 Tax=Lichtheimia ornata TaxID=688661 RepID=A0AAD7V7N1_9FUNG|nr:uncharacterized protein O0I10_004398 [Lichtheimia ornata]KAJ8659805.1 hypothetical protein O0I10_004398 [Lichtheimia ornata]